MNHPSLGQRVLQMENARRLPDAPRQISSDYLLTGVRHAERLADIEAYRAGRRAAPVIPWRDRLALARQLFVRLWAACFAAPRLARPATLEPTFRVSRPPLLTGIATERDHAPPGGLVRPDRSSRPPPGPRLG